MRFPRGATPLIAAFQKSLFPILVISAGLIRHWAAHAEDDEY